MESYMKLKLTVGSVGAELTHLVLRQDACLYNMLMLILSFNWLSKYSFRSINSCSFRNSVVFHIFYFYSAQCIGHTRKESICQAGRVALISMHEFGSNTTTG